MVVSQENNKKLTFKKDFDELECSDIDLLNRIRVGQGYDLHLLKEGRRLVIGGIEIPFEKGLLGHSDADVLLHAITDAILGAAGLGDIGGHFPDTDEKYRDADSALLLSQVKDEVYKKGYRIINLDMTLFLEEPKMKNYRERIVDRIADILEIDKKTINLKAKTMEGTGAIGKGEAIGASATCLMRMI
ncbi:MAG: 2-C-methyl-D-erythritol 2,4-cyclodiphosphate synthase [Clostridia bacterium]|nr:2-C-methyl-D-erythritol 2,4-cyclodiphosphate synthase [Clostridia bacterium]